MTGREDNDQLQPLEDRGAANDSRGQIAESTPPEGPTVGRLIQNLPVILKRSLGAVAWAWLAVATGIATVLTIVISAAQLQRSAWRLAPTDSTVHLTPGSGLGLLGLVLVVVACLAVVLVGPMRPVRKVTFEGKRAVPTVIHGVQLMVERIFPITGLLLGSIVLFGGFFALVDVSAFEFRSFVSTDRHNALAIAIQFFLIPMVYLVAVTDGTFRACLRTTVDLLGRHTGYLLGGYLVLTVATIATEDLVYGVLQWLADAGPQLLEIAPTASANLVRMVVCVALFATIEETDGPFHL